MACGFHILNSVPTLSHRALSNFNRMSFIHFLLCEIKRKSPYFQMFLASTKNNFKNARNNYIQITCKSKLCSQKSYGHNRRIKALISAGISPLHFRNRHTHM